MQEPAKTEKNNKIYENNSVVQWRIKVTQEPQYSLNYVKFVVGGKSTLVVKEQIFSRIYVNPHLKENSFELSMSYSQANDSTSPHYILNRSVQIDAESLKSRLHVTDKKNNTICLLDIKLVKTKRIASGISATHNSAHIYSRGSHILQNPKQKSGHLYEENYSIGSQCSQKDALLSNHKFGLKRYKSITNDQIGSSSSSVGKNSKKQFFNKIGYINRLNSNNGANSSKTSKFIDQRTISDIGAAESNMRKDIVLARYLNVKEEFAQEEEAKQQLKLKQLTLLCSKGVLKRKFDDQVVRLAELEKRGLKQKSVKNISDKKYSVFHTVSKYSPFKDDMSIPVTKPSSGVGNVHEELSELREVKAQHMDLAFEYDELVTIRNRLLRKKEKQLRTRGFAYIHNVAHN